MRRTVQDDDFGALRLQSRDGGPDVSGQGFDMRGRNGAALAPCDTGPLLISVDDSGAVAVQHGSDGERSGDLTLSGSALARDDRDHLHGIGALCCLLGIGYRTQPPRRKSLVGLSFQIPMILGY